MIETHFCVRGGFMKTAVIILGHGSRAEGAGESVAALAETLRNSGQFGWVEHAFLQYAPPTFEQAVGQCVDRGASCIVIVPFFVQTGAHVSRDIPALVGEFRKRFPSVQFQVTGHVGGHPMMVNIVEELVKKSNAE